MASLFLAILMFTSAGSPLYANTVTATPTVENQRSNINHFNIVSEPGITEHPSGDGRLDLMTTRKD